MQTLDAAGVSKEISAQTENKTGKPTADEQCTTYIQEDIGIFIGFLTAPYENIHQFYQTEIERVFEKYKSQLHSNLTKAMELSAFNESNTDEETLNTFKEDYEKALHEFNRYLYVPQTYITLGRFDLAVIALTDDFDFGVRTFQPCSWVGSSDNNKDQPLHPLFQHQNINGVNPFLSSYEPNVNTAQFWEDKLKFPVNADGLRERENEFSLIGFCSLKINSSLAIGNNKNLLKLIDIALGQRGEKFKKERGTGADGEELIHGFDFETVSWNEIMVVALANDYSLIAELFQQFKDLTVQAIYDACNPAEQGELNGLEQSIRAGEKGAPQPGFKEAHLFVKAVITLGFDYRFVKEGFKLLQQQPNGNKEEIISDYINNPATGLFKISQTRNLHQVKRWHIRTGHKQKVGARLDKLFEETNARKNLFRKDGMESVTMGSADYSQLFLDQSSYDVVVGIIKAYLLNHDDIERDIHQSISMTDVNYKPETQQEDITSGEEINIPGGDSDNHYFHRELLKKLQFNKPQLQKLIINLRQLRVSKALAKDIESCFTQFNDHISDAAMYNYFIELYPMLKAFLESIYQAAQQLNSGQPQSAEHLQKRLYGNCEGFKKAFENRIRQSYYMAEINDHCFEFKGGAHQLVSVADGAYKFVASKFGQAASYSFYTSNPSITANEFYVRLNLYHLIQPEILLSIALHEAMHSFTFSSLPNTRQIMAIKDNIQAYLNLRREQIYQDARAIEVNNELYKSISVIIDQLAEYILLDLTTYSVACNKNLPYFLRLKWLYMIQLPDSYDNNGTFNSRKLQQYFSRLIIAECLVTQGAPVINKPVQQYETYKIFATLVNNNTDILNHVTPAFETALQHAQQLFDDDYALINIETTTRTSGAILIETEEDCYRPFKRLSINQETGMLYQYINDIAAPFKIDEAHSQQILQRLIKGQIVSPSYIQQLTGVDQVNCDFTFINMLSYSFLSLFYDNQSNYSFPGAASGMLMRDYKSGREQMNEASRNMVNFDPRGGTFTVWPQIRRKLFQARMAVSRSILQAYNFHKKNYLPQPEGTQGKFRKTTTRSAPITKKKPAMLSGINCFISSASINHTMAVKLKAGLEQTRISAIPYTNTKGPYYYVECKGLVSEEEKFKRIKDFMDTYLRVSQRFIVYIDKNYLESAYCLYELLRICETDKKIGAALLIVQNKDILTELKHLKRSQLREKFVKELNQLQEGSEIYNIFKEVIAQLLEPDNQYMRNLRGWATGHIRWVHEGYLTTPNLLWRCLTPLVRMVKSDYKPKLTSKEENERDEKIKKIISYFNEVYLPCNL